MTCPLVTSCTTFSATRLGAAHTPGAMMGVCTSTEMIGRLPYRRTLAVDRPTCFRRSFATIARGRCCHTATGVRGRNDSNARAAARVRPPGGAAPLSGAERGDRSAREGPARLLVLPSLLAASGDGGEPRWLAECPLVACDSAIVMPVIATLPRFSCSFRVPSGILPATCREETGGALAASRRLDTRQKRAATRRERGWVH